MSDYWAKLFIDDIVTMWQRYKDSDYDRYIFQYADEEFVWKNIDRLNTSQYDYALLCRRLGNSLAASFIE